MKRLLVFAMIIGVTLATLSAADQAGQKSMPTPPPARKIPGITVNDPFPNGCVDCHINYPDMKLDARFSTFMKQWNESVEPKLLAKAQAAAPAGLTLKGKHPVVAAALKDIPAGCLTCHNRESNFAPPFARMLHLIHLTGGEENNFLTMFQGECTYCHKLDKTTGHWSEHSGPEH